MVSTEDLLRDFVDNNLETITVQGREFKYRRANAGDQNKWLNEVIYLEGDEVKEDKAKLNLMRLNNVVESPYNREVIEKVIGVNKDWNELSKEEKHELFENLNPSIFSELILKIKQLEKGTQGDIKNP